MKPIVIAGNGPSLAQIDYSRLPQDFDVFRCNQFYFEDKYFLGKKIKGAFFNSNIIEEQIFTLHFLEKNGDYDIDSIYCRPRLTDGSIKIGDKNLFEVFPHIQNTYDFLVKQQMYSKLEFFYRHFYDQYPTMGIVMLYTAIAQGYREIYLTGIDFYTKNEANYAFAIEAHSMLAAKIPEFKNKDYKNSQHTKEIDISFLEMALKNEEIKIFSISPNSSLCDTIPLAKPYREPNIEILRKEQGYISDILLPEKRKLSFGKKFRNNLKELGKMHNIRNIFYIFFSDLGHIFKAMLKSLKK